jgi:hypothetical protein
LEEFPIPRMADLASPTAPGRGNVLKVCRCSCRAPLPSSPPSEGGLRGEVSFAFCFPLVSLSLYYYHHYELSLLQWQHVNTCSENLPDATWPNLKLRCLGAIAVNSLAPVLSGLSVCILYLCLNGERHCIL